MNLYLFGGTGPSNYLKQWEDTFSILNEIKPKELLFIPFASGKDNYVTYSSNLLKSKLTSTAFFDARNNEDIEKAVTPLIFIIGGHDHVGLFQSVTQNKKLENLVRTCENFIGESAGAMIAGTFQRASSDRPMSPLMK